MITLSRRSRAIVSFSACQCFNFCSKTPFFKAFKGISKQKMVVAALPFLLRSQAHNLLRCDMAHEAREKAGIMDWLL